MSLFFGCESPQKKIIIIITIIINLNIYIYIHTTCTCGRDFHDMKFSREVSSHQVRKASEVVKVPGWEAKGFPLSFAIKAGFLSRSELGMLLFFFSFLS